MIKRLTLDDMMEQFRLYNRDNYSYEAYEYMYEYMESWDRNWEIDVIALCGMFDEFEESELEDCDGCVDTIELSNGNFLRIWQKEETLP